MEYIQEINRCNLLSSCLYMNLNSNKTNTIYKIINNSLTVKESLIDLSYYCNNDDISYLIFTPFEKLDEWIKLCNSKFTNPKIITCSTPSEFYFFNKVNNPNSYIDKNYFIFIPIRFFSAFDMFCKLNSNNPSLYFKFLIIENPNNLPLYYSFIKSYYTFYLSKFFLQNETQYINLNFKCKFKDIIYKSIFKYITPIGDFIIDPSFTIVIRESTTQTPDNNQNNIVNNIPSLKHRNIVNHLNLLKSKTNNIIYFKNDKDKLFWMLVYPLFTNYIHLCNIEFYNVFKFINNIKLVSFDKSLINLTIDIYNKIYKDTHPCICCNTQSTTCLLLCCFTSIHLDCSSKLTSCPNCKYTNPIIFNKNYSYYQRIYDSLITNINPKHIFVCKNKKTQSIFTSLCRFNKQKIYPIYIKDLDKKRLENATQITYITDFDYNVDPIIRKENKIFRSNPIILNVIQL